MFFKCFTISFLKIMATNKDDHFLSRQHLCKRKKIETQVVCVKDCTPRGLQFIQSFEPNFNVLEDVIEYEYFMKQVDEKLPPGSVGRFIHAICTQESCLHIGLNYYKLKEVIITIDL